MINHYRQAQSQAQSQTQLEFLQEVFKEREMLSLMGGKLFPLIDSINKTKHLTGNAAEVGVYKGGSARLIAYILRDKNIFLFDTFEGMPEDDEMKKEIGAGHSAGDFFEEDLFDSVKDYLSDLPNCKFFQGYFPDTALDLHDEQFSFVHLDADIYQSTKSGIEFFYPKLVSGGIIFFDDYNWIACPGVKKAIDEYFSDKEDEIYKNIICTQGSDPQLCVCEIIKR